MIKSFRLKNIFISFVACLAMMAVMITAFAAPVKNKAQAAPNDRVNNANFTGMTTWIDHIDTSPYNRATPSGNNLLCYVGDESTTAFGGGNGSKAYPFIIRHATDLTTLFMMANYNYSGSPSENFVFNNYITLKHFKVVATDAVGGKGGTIDLGGYLWQGCLDRYFGIAEFDGNGVTIKNLTGTSSLFSDYSNGLNSHRVITDYYNKAVYDDIFSNVTVTNEGGDVTYSGSGLSELMIIKDFIIDGATVKNNYIIAQTMRGVIIDNITIRDSQFGWVAIICNFFELGFASDIVVESSCYGSGVYGESGYGHSCFGAINTASLLNITIEANYFNITYTGVSQSFLYHPGILGRFENIFLNGTIRYGSSAQGMFGYISAYDDLGITFGPMMKFKNCVNNSSVINGSGMADSIEGFSNEDLGLTYKLIEFENCGNTGALTTGIQDYHYGFARKITNVKLTNCYNTGSGFGFAGSITDSNLTGCYNSGSITISGNGNTKVSGFSLDIINSTLSNCYNAGDLSCSYARVYGFSENIQNSSLNTCFNTGNLSSAIAGFAGTISDSDFNNCYNSGSVENTLAYSAENNYSTSVYGFAVQITNTSLNNCRNTGNIYSRTTNATGVTNGVFGFADNVLINSDATKDITIKDCYNSGNIDAVLPIYGFAYRAGALSKTAKSITFEGCYNQGVALTTTASYHGFAYSAKFATFKNCGNKQSVVQPTAFSTVNSGKVYGFAYEVIRVNMEGCYNTALLYAKGSGSVPLAVGFVYNVINSELTGCYNSGTLRTVGGTGIYGFAYSIIVDFTATQDSVIKDCYNSGDLKFEPGGTSAPALCGFAYNIGYLAEKVPLSVLVSGCYNTGKFITFTVNNAPVTYNDILGWLAAYETKKLAEGKSAVSETERFEIIELLMARFLVVRSVGSTVVQDIFGSGLNLSESQLITYILDSATIQASSSASSVSAYGFCYVSCNLSVIENCYNTADILSRFNAAGFAWGYPVTQNATDNVTIRGSYNTGAVLGQVSVGFMFCIYEAQLYDCFNLGDVYKVGYDGGDSGRPGSYVAGFLSYHRAIAWREVVDHCYNAGNIYTVAQSYIGGLVGYTYSSSSYVGWDHCFTNSYNSGSINVFKPKWVAYQYRRTISVGGIIGCKSAGYTTRVENCFNTGNIKIHYTETATDGTTSYPYLFYVGGIVGNALRVADGSSYGNFQVFSNCYNTGDISYGVGNDGRASGIINITNTSSSVSSYYDFHLIIENCYNIGKIIGEPDKVAGVAWLRGMNQTRAGYFNYVRISNCYSLDRFIEYNGNVYDGSAPEYPEQKLLALNGEATFYSYATSLTSPNKLYIDIYNTETGEIERYSHITGATVGDLFTVIGKITKTNEQLKEPETYPGITVNPGILDAPGWGVNVAKPNTLFWQIDDSVTNPINNGYPYLEGSNIAQAVVLFGLNGKQKAELSFDEGSDAFAAYLGEYDLYEIDLSVINAGVVGYDFVSWYFNGYNTFGNPYSSLILDANSVITLYLDPSNNKYYLFGVKSAGETVNVYVTDGRRIEMSYIFQIFCDYEKAIYKISTDANVSVLTSYGTAVESFKLGDTYMIRLPAVVDLYSFATLMINGAPVTLPYWNDVGNNKIGDLTLTEDMITAYGIIPSEDGSGFTITAEYVNDYAKVSVIKNNNNMVASVYMNAMPVVYGETTVFLLGSVLTINTTTSFLYKINEDNPYSFNINTADWSIILSSDKHTCTITLPDTFDGVLNLIVTVNLEKVQFEVETDVRLKRTKTAVIVNVPSISNTALITFDELMSGSISITENNYYKFVNWIIISESGTEYYIGDFTSSSFPTTLTFTKNFITEYLHSNMKLKIVAEVYTKIEVTVTINPESLGNVSVVGVTSRFGSITTDERDTFFDDNGVFKPTGKIYIVSGSRVDVYVSYIAGYTIKTDGLGDGFSYSGKNANYTITFITQPDATDSVAFVVAAQTTSYYISFEYLDSNKQVLTSSDDPYFDNRPTAEITERIPGSAGERFNPNIGEHGAYEFYVTETFNSITVPGVTLLKEYKFVGWFYKVGNNYIAIPQDYYMSVYELMITGIDQDFMNTYYDENQGKVIFYAMFVKQLSISVVIPEEFKTMGTFTVTIAGTLKDTPDAITENTSTYIASLGDVVVITANVTNATYYGFVSFNITSNGNVCTFIVESYTNIVLTYKTIPQTIQFNKDTSGAKGDVSISKQEVSVGDTLVLTFNPETGYDLSSWIINGKRVQDLADAANSNYHLSGNTLRITVTEEWLNENINLSTVVKTTMNRTYLIILLSFGSVVPVLIVLIAIFLVLNAKKRKLALEILKKRQEAAAMMAQAGMITALKEGVNVGPQGTEISQKDIRDQMRKM